MHEGRVVATAPTELGSQTNHNRILNPVLRREVTDLLRGGSVLVLRWHELGHLHHGKHGGVADVAQSFDRVQVHEVMHQPQVIVVSHRHVQLLHQLGTGTAARHGAINLELAGEEFFVLGLDLVDNSGRVDVLSKPVEVDRSELLSARGLPVVVVKDAR